MHSANSLHLLNFQRIQCGTNAADHPFVRMFDGSQQTAVSAPVRHLDLACQGQADIQMLYYYITFHFKMQGLLRIFFIFPKTVRMLYILRTDGQNL